MNKNTIRQLITLKEWRSNNPKKTDPHFSGRLIFDRHTLSYLVQCIEMQESPEFFVSLWINDDGDKASLGIAVPVEWVNPVNRAALEDYDEWTN